jgi:hypothetical protein
MSSHPRRIRNSDSTPTSAERQWLTRPIPRCRSALFQTRSPPSVCVSILLRDRMRVEIGARVRKIDGSALAVAKHSLPPTV